MGGVEGDQRGRLAAPPHAPGVSPQARRVVDRPSSRSATRSETPTLSLASWAVFMISMLLGNSLGGVVLVAVLNQSQVMLRAGCRAAFTDRATE